MRFPRPMPAAAIAAAARKPRPSTAYWAARSARRAGKSFTTRPAAPAATRNATKGASLELRCSNRYPQAVSSRKEADSSSNSGKTRSAVTKGSTRVSKAENVPASAVHRLASARYSRKIRRSSEKMYSV